jgi:hypothetical protein
MIKSGAVIQNRYLNNPYPTNYNPLGRPGNFDVVRPHDSSSVFDTGMPKDVSPYQPRVAVSVEIQPKSVFKPRRLQRQLKQVNGAKWGQTALKNIFGGEENVITNYMAQRLLGIVEGSDNRMDQPMSLDNPLLDFREPFNEPTASTTTARPSNQSDESMGPFTPVSGMTGVGNLFELSLGEDESMGPFTPVSGMTGIGNLFDLSLGEAPLRINIPEPRESGMTGVGEMISPDSFPGITPTSQDGAQAVDGAVAEAVAEVETQPAAAAAQGGLLDIVQETAAGTATVRPRNRGFGLGETTRRPTNFIGDVLNY